jgi:polysaccharide biosynthesis transport protein
MNEYSDSGLSFAQLFAILSARKFTIALTVLVTIACTYSITQYLPKTYTASAELFIDYRANDPLATRQFSPMADESYMLTQVDMLKSEEVANHAVDVTNMMATEGAKKLVQLEGEARARNTIVTQVARDLDVVLRRSSRVVELRFSSDSPTQARDTLNASIKGYIDLVTRMSAAPAKSRQEQYSTQLDTLRQELDKIQTSITDYQQRYGILDADERLDTESRQLTDLSVRQTSLEAQRMEANSRRRSIEGLVRSGVTAADIPEIAGQRGLPELRLRLADSERQMAEIGSVYGRNHPRFKIVTAERDTLLQRLERESQIALKTVSADEGRFDQQAQVLSGEIRSRQRKLLEMKKHRDVIGSYQRQMETVRQIYTAAVQKYDELLIASTVNSPTLAVLRWAVAPYTHSKPKLRNNLLMSVPIGLLLGLGIVFLTELSGRRVRHIDDLERELNMDVLGRVGERKR